jgi:hypothetical protein
MRRLRKIAGETIRERALLNLAMPTEFAAERIAFEALK